MNQRNWKYALICGALSLHAAGETTPEKELHSATMQLNLAVKQTDTVGKLSSTKKLEPFASNIAATLGRARTYLESTDFAAAAAEAKDFIRASQSLSMGDHLEALTIIAKSSEALGDYRAAVTHYRHYVTAFLSHKSKDYTALTKNINSMLAITSDTQDISGAEMKRIIAGVLSQKIPTNYLADIMYAAARTAMEQRHYDLAREWLNTASKNAPDGHLKSRSHYFQGLLHLNRGEYDSAKGALAKAVQEDSKGAKEYAERSYLALARIAVKEQQPDTALAYYNKISPDSVVGRRAAFEKIYVVLELNQPAQAESLARSFVEKHPSGEASYALRNLLSYLELRSGNWDKSITSIDQHEARMLADMRAISEQYARKQRMTEKDIQDLSKKMAPYMRPTQETTAALELFRRIDDAQKRISQLQGDTRDFSYTMGRHEIDQMRPQWQLQGEQLAKLSHTSLAQGERISAAEQEYYKSMLTPTDQLRLKSLRDLRKRLTTQGALERNHFSHWRNWLNIAQIESRLVGLQKKLLQTYQEARSNQYMSATFATVDQLAQDQNTKLTVQTQRGYEAVQRMREIARKERILDISSRSGAQSSKEFLISYAVLLKEDESILEQYRKKQVEPAAQAFARDANTAWRRWNNATKSVFTKLVDLRNGMNKDVKGMMSEVDGHQEQQIAIMDKLQKIKGHLELLLGDNTNKLLSQFERSVSEQQAKHRKWKADIEWLKYSKAESTRDAESVKMATQYQMLKDNLNSLKQGAIW